MKLIPLSWTIECTAEELGLPLVGASITISFDSKENAEAIHALLVRGMYCRLNHNNPDHNPHAKP